MILNLVQGSPAWAHWKTLGLGGSDAPVILDAHRRRPGAQHDLKALLADKLAPTPPDPKYPPHFRYRGPGDAVRELSRRVGYELRPCCAQHDAEPWLRCTLEGATWAGDAVAKCGHHTIAGHEQALAGELPEGVEAMAQHCLLVTGADLLWYVSQSKAKRFAPAERFAVVEVYPDGEFMAELTDALRAFWDRVQRARGARATA